MKYTIEKKLSGFRIVQGEKEGPKILADYTITGQGEHKGAVLAINEGISVEVGDAASLIKETDTKAQEQIDKLYIND